MITPPRRSTLRLPRPLSVALVGATILGSLGTLLADGNHPDRSPGSVWVVNRDPVPGLLSGDLTVFDAATGAPVAAPITLGRGAHDVAIAQRAGRAFVTNETDNSVMVFSTSTLELIDTIPFAAGSRPHHLEASDDGRAVAVGLFGTNRIALIDTRTLTVREYASNDQPAQLAHAPRLSPGGRFVYVPHEMGNLLTRVSVRTGRIRALPLSEAPLAGPSEVLSTADGETLFVSMRNENSVKIVDAARLRIVDEIAVGIQPESLILTPGERTLVVSLRGTPAQLAFIDRKSGSVQRVTIAEGPTFGDLAVRSPDGRYVYVTFDTGASGQGGVAKVDVKKRSVIATWPYPRRGRPHGVAYSTSRLR